MGNKAKGRSESIFNFLKRRLANAARRRMMWITPRRLYMKLDQVPIHKPIFMLGVQGGGLTLINKALQRHSQAVFCLGNNSMWDAGDNEIHAFCHDPEMPSIFSFWRNKTIPSKFPTNHWRYWTYAVDETIDLYRVDPNTIDEENYSKFQRVIKRILRGYAHDVNTARFIDKSQLYTINIPLVRKALNGSSPCFVVVTRNPYAIIKRVAEKYYLSPSKLNFSFSHSEAIRYCAQHWRNSFSSALEARNGIPDVKIMRFEDFIASPEKFLKELCAFVDLPFETSMVPAPDQKYTVYASLKKKWYPLYDSNEDYLNKLMPGELSIIREVCGDLPKMLGYEEPLLKAFVH